MMGKEVIVRSSSIKFQHRSINGDDNALVPRTFCTLDHPPNVISVFQHIQLKEKYGSAVVGHIFQAGRGHGG
eukprot:jgi/Pico_ML_1/53155/g3757.t1